MAVHALGERDRYARDERKRMNKCLMIIMMIGCLAAQAKAQSPAPESNKVLVTGFVGGFRSPDDIKQGVVQIRDHLRSLACPGLQVETFSHWHWRRAYHWIYQAIDQNRDGKLSKTEIEQCPKIIVYGHSLGGWAVVKLATKLKKIKIPLELAVQIDSVGIGDEVEPNNVKEAANFYQRTVWPIRGERHIRAQNENMTRIIGNFLIKDVGHEALAKELPISKLITEKVVALCTRP